MTIKEKSLATVDTYNAKWQTYVEKTSDITKFQDVKNSLNDFRDLILDLSASEERKSVLDIGFGSGRDILWFNHQGFSAYGIDPSKKFVDYALDKGLNVARSFIQEFDCETFDIVKFDGIWCCSVLLHVPPVHLDVVFTKITSLLKGRGVFYFSTKLGNGSEFVQDADSNVGSAGRYFYYYSQNQLASLLKSHNYSITNLKITDSVRNNGDKWISVLANRME